MNETYLSIFSGSRLRPKVVAYFANINIPISTRKLAKLLNEDVGAIGHLIREYVDRDFIQRTDQGYVLAATHIQPELASLSRLVTPNQRERE